MKKFLLLFLVVFLLSGCSKYKEYELVIDTNECLNCYKKIYEFSDGTEVYSSCPKITYKTKKTEISIKEALDKKLLTLSDLKKEDGFKIFKSKEDKILSCGN